MRTTLGLLTATLVAGAAGLVGGVATAADPFLNSTWNTTYTTEQNDSIQASVRFTSNGGQFGNGSYNAYSNGQPVGQGTFSQVRVEADQRQSSPLPGPGSGGNNFGLPQNQTKYIKGLWDFSGTRGWFKWELYEAGGSCRFTGTWGFLENNTAGPTRGSWRGDLTSGGGGGGGNGPVIPIP